MAKYVAGARNPGLKAGVPLYIRDLTMPLDAS